MTDWTVFTQWWMELEPKLLKTARFYVVSDDEAKDIVQDVAVLAIRTLYRSGFNDAQHFHNWAYSRLRWLTLDRFRVITVRRRNTRPEDEISTEPSIAAVQEQKFAVRDILASVAKLPTQQQAVMRGIIEGRSVNEIAKNLKIKEATVRSLRRFARKTLISLLKEKEV